MDPAACLSLIPPWPSCRLVYAVWRELTWPFRFSAGRRRRQISLLRFINFYNTVKSHKGIDGMTPYERLYNFFYGRICKQREDFWQIMKYLNFILVSLLMLGPAYAGSEGVLPKYDKVVIGYVPAKSASIHGAPYVTLEAKVLKHHKSRDIERFFVRLNKLASEGITDNATRLHKATKYIEATFQGESIRLFFSGDTGLNKFKQYEEKWQILYNEIYDYLVMNQRF